MNAGHSNPARWTERLRRKWRRRGEYLLLVAIGFGAINAYGAADAETIARLMLEYTAAERSYLEATRATDAEAADSRMADARDRLERSTLKLDQARLDRIVEFAAVDRAIIQQRRAAGVSWMDIAFDLGVHPSIIGITIVDDRPPAFDSALP